MPQPWWTIDGRVALAELAEARLRVDLADPAAGLAVTLAGDPRAAPARLLGVRLPAHPPGDAAALADAYSREGDLVVTYAQTPGRPLRVQVYWRIATAGPGPRLTLDCLVSVQTSLLDAASLLAVESHWPAGEALRPAGRTVEAFRPMSAGRVELNTADGPGCVLLRPTGGSISYAEMIHPDDFTDDELAPASGGLRLVHRLFGGELEKGVILRARLRAVVVPRDADEPSLRAAYEDLLHAPLPLTV